MERRAQSLPCAMDEREAGSPRAFVSGCASNTTIDTELSERCTEDGASTDDDLWQVKGEENIFSVIPL
ncbi:hypothetical protein ALC62_09506 [Cyphomyrmex costatus]|uniref:Uncharacterized protein n=1 Tax=Cyphomyrmex costatus TaxID=456900 RepID=A0A195CGM9_9HYME|nr:hypothetical protein ALC62_09506 [Cyphomyrmex costatus]